MKAKTTNLPAKPDTAERIVEQILAALDRGVSPWHRPWRDGYAPRNLVTGRAYRGANALLLGLMDYEDPRYLTFHAALDMGANVRKGERGHLVMFWQRHDYTVRLEDEDGDVVEETRTGMLIRGYTVFNVAQGENIPAAALAKTAPKGNEKAAKPIKEAEAIWQGNYHGDNAPRFGTSRNGRSFYAPALDAINLPPKKAFEDAESYYATLFHEAAHSTGHESRLARFPAGNFAEEFGSEPYAREELVAEIASQFLCQRAGTVRTLDNAAAYCKSWAKAIREQPARAFLTAAAQAQKAADYILGEGIAPED